MELSISEILGASLWIEFEGKKENTPLLEALLEKAEGRKIISWIEKQKDKNKPVTMYRSETGVLIEGHLSLIYDFFFQRKCIKAVLLELKIKIKKLPIF